MSELPVEAARWLTTGAGERAIAVAVDELDAGRDELGVVTALRARGIDAQHSSAAVTVAGARIRARSRWPSSAQRMLFTREALEQASDPAISRHRARRFAGDDRRVDERRDEDPRVWDLCAGVGGDAIALASAGLTVTCVEQDPARAVLLRHNLEVAGAVADVEVADARGVCIPATARWHADPGRRRGDRRVRALRDHRPPVGDLLAAHGSARGFALTLAPGVSHEDPELRDDCEIEYLQLGDDLVEATAWFGATRSPTVVASATLLPSGEHRERDDAARSRLPVADVDAWLVVPAPAAVRARLHDDIGATIDARRIAEHRALLTTPTPPAPSAWYRARPVAAVLQARPREVRAWLATVEQRPVEVVLHGARIDPVAWWRQLGRPERGPRGWRLEVVRRDHDTVVVVTDGGQPVG